MNEPIYFTDEHRQFRDNLRRFIAQEILPKADAWEEAGMVPREVLRRMGPTAITPNLISSRWSKLLLNACMSGMSAALCSDFGGVIDWPYELVKEG